VYEPVRSGGTRVEQLAIAQADHELSAAGVSRRQTEPWSSVRTGPFTLTALPAVDGTGDPQVSWLVEADDTRVLHLGDTLFHGWWWRITERYGAPDVVLAPINGARLTLPHRRPASPFPGAMDPEHAAVAAELLRADRLVPIHFDGYDLPGIYEPIPNALERLTAASDRVRTVGLGDQIDIQHAEREPLRNATS
jgi:L-ascorbate metabolism protein UlaG (beta-lactamase superfamily)